MNAVRKVRRVAAGMLMCPLCLALPLAAQASATANFQVAVALVQASEGVCVSTPQAPAEVLVTCTSGHFVDLAMRQAFRYHVAGGVAGIGRIERSTETGAKQQTVSAAALQVSSSRDSHAGQVEILVSF